MGHVALFICVMVSPWYGDLRAETRGEIMAEAVLFRILMVCTGNICRSPCAEGVLRHMLAENGLGARVEIDSAGTSQAHNGEEPTLEARAAAKKRGYVYTGRSRSVTDSDYRSFDLILGMDHGHMARLRARQPAGSSAELALFLSQSPHLGRDDVPDPFYGGAAAYEYALDLIEAGCRDWVEALRTRLPDVPTR